MKKPLFVFDLDGVLVNPGSWFEENPSPRDRHRGDPGYEMWLRRYENWANLNADPNEGMVKVFSALQEVVDVIVLSSRSEKSREGTSAWVEDYCGRGTCDIYLRPKDDFEGYAAFKVKVLEKIAGSRPIVMFDDDPSGDLKVLFDQRPGWMLCRVSGGGKVPGRE